MTLHGEPTLCGAILVPFACPLTGLVRYFMPVVAEGSKQFQIYPYYQCTPFDKMAGERY